ncbi:hypothetical protein [Agreia sp. COWG]|uniref:hypothetical protein n=1 Tax=Agreia sp. COWG TaxID=2773266 RepID=UPI001926FE14|nr:hypothetical protein [Agreia sp. COWG]CAD6010299.1 conserved protein of unknown function [Agreia sp. COWG]
MTPRSGGESDKFGNAYEGAWTVAQILQIVSGEALSITIEKAGSAGEGAEFILETRDGLQAHQVKRQLGDETQWTVASLKAKGIWSAARSHVAVGISYHFVSTIPARMAQELCDRSRRSDSSTDFVDELLTSKTLEDAFNDLCQPELLGTADDAWKLLRQCWFSTVGHVEREKDNAAMANVLIAGAEGRLICAGIADLAISNMGIRLSATEISAKLEEYGLSIAGRGDADRALSSINSATNTWLTSVENELVEPQILRIETQDVLSAIRTNKITIAAGLAGSGKSAISQQVARGLSVSPNRVLAFRLDRIDGYATTAQLGNQIGLTSSPVEALGRAADGSECVLLVDQLDAVSLISGRSPLAFDVVAELIREAKAFQSMKILLVCRQFDLANDERFRSLSAREKAVIVSIGLLTPSQVDSALNVLEIPQEALDAVQREMLRTPLHLKLFSQISDSTSSYEWSSIIDLFDAFWERKQRDVVTRRKGSRFAAVIGVLAEAISERKTLSVHISVLDEGDLGADANALLSEQVLVRDGSQVAFFHESFFDYAFARSWILRRVSILDFLDDVQPLFVRGQVRQILAYLRSSDPARYLRELRALITSPKVRFHIKEAAFATLTSSREPTLAELDVLIEIVESDPSLRRRSWRVWTEPSWAVLMDARKLIDAWFASEESEDRAISALGALLMAQPERTFEIVDRYQSSRLASSIALALSQIPTLYEHQRGRDIFLGWLREDVFKGNQRHPWHAAVDAVSAHEGFALAILRAHLIDRPSALEASDHGLVPALGDHDEDLAQIIAVAANDSATFLDFVLPYLERVCELTSHGRSDWFRTSRHFSLRVYVRPGRHVVGDVLVDRAVAAIRHLAAHNPDLATTYLKRMTESDWSVIQELAFEGLEAGAEFFADWAADLIITEPRRMMISNNTENPVWSNQRLISAIVPFLGSVHLLKLEDYVRDFRFERESIPYGRHAYALLTSFPEEALSTVGRRRLQEYQRKFALAPGKPAGIQSGFVAPPIPQERAARMGDGQWLSAMRTHDGNGRSWSELRGGAHELAQVLHAEARKDPARFAKLATALPSDVNLAYPAAILLGLAEAEELEEPAPVFSAVIHLARIGEAEIDRWLFHAVGKYGARVPLDLVAAVLKRCLLSPDPADDGIRVRRSDSNGISAEEVLSSGINTARGSLADDLADLIVQDPSGKRSRLVATAVSQLSKDPALAVRVYVARVVHALMRDMSELADGAARDLLLSDPRSLAFRPMVFMAMALGSRDPRFVIEVAQKQLRDLDGDARQGAGNLIAFASAEWGMPDLLDEVLVQSDTRARVGAAEMLAGRLQVAENSDVCRMGLQRLFHDDDDLVRHAAAEIAWQLRGEPLGKNKELLINMVKSPAFEEALPQLVITLEESTEKIDDLVKACVEQIETWTDRPKLNGHIGLELGELAKLIVRALAQTPERSDQSRFLDGVDALLRAGGYGVDDLVAAAER